MNKPNNKRSRNTDEAIIHAAFAAMVEGKKPVSKITVREICERAQINRSTFYAHYMDVYDLFEKVESQMAQMFQENFRSFEKSGESWDFLLAMERVFQFIYEYRDFFGLYFREAGRVSTIIHILVDPFQEQISQLKSRRPEGEVEGEINYHFNFFTAGVGAMIAHWLDTGCKETPAQLVEVLKREYGPNSLFCQWTAQ
ncbi:TetR/AcrR family transcriptional regulator [Oscillospiraceae bacterium 42-9]